MPFSTKSDRLHKLGPQISEILTVSGAAGASIGIIEGLTGERHLGSFGYRDIEQQLVPDEHTIYHIASLSKSFTATSIALLVADGKIAFEDRMCDVLPGFHHFNDAVCTESTVLDFLSHRTGLATKNSLWQQDGHELLLLQEDTLPIVSYLEVVEPLGSKWIYNNWGYDILANVIAAASGFTWGEVVSERILEPLGLKETTTDLRPPEKKNWAQGYMPGLLDGELTNVGRPVISAGTVQQGANGVKSTVHDLLLYYSAILEAYTAERSELTNQTTNPRESPLKKHQRAAYPAYTARRQ